MRGRRILQTSRRLYWIGCGALVCIGIAGLVATFVFPLERFDADGNLIGEMPPTFGPSLLLALLGVLGALCGAVVLSVTRIGHWIRARR